MDYRSLFLITLLCAVVISSSTTILPNLRRYRTITSAGLFAVPRDKLEAIIKARMNEDIKCGNFVSLSLPEPLPSLHSDRSLYGEVMLVYGRVEEKDVDYLPCDLQEELETSYRSLQLFIPHLSNGNHGLLTIVDMTEAKNRLTPPLLTNDDYRINVEAIKEDRGRVTLHVGNDNMTLDVFKNASCQEANGEVGNDFDKIHGRNLTVTNYPKRFNWDCGSVIDWDTGYCRVLKDHLCEIQRFDRDVCIHATTASSIRCPSTMTITSADGYFRDIMSGMFDTFPVESFEGESIDRDHSAGIKFPCLSKVM